LKLTHVNTQDEQPRIVPFNPLGKIPALVLDDGSVLFDSPVICEYLDAEFGGRRLLPASGAGRWRAMTRAALADGILDAAILVRHERLRPAERQSPEWIARHLGKIYDSLDALEREAASFGDHLDLGLIGVGAALGYVQLRIPECKDLTRWPALARWFAEVSRRPSFERTVPRV
ncbi:MAG TPA: glutathione S-transferase family protein, partial [Casimicrobiaceae bacterium]|nr:glutathione S-transferase family protein [Casimicrobiaceae bacterium]